MTNFDTQFNLTTLVAYLNGLSSTSKISASGTVVYSVVGTTENCCGVAAIGAGTASNTITVTYHGTGDAGITDGLQYGPGAGANFQITDVIDTVIKVI